MDCKELNFQIRTNTSIGVTHENSAYSSFLPAPPPSPPPPSRRCGQWEKVDEVNPVEEEEGGGGEKEKEKEAEGGERRAGTGGWKERKDERGKGAEDEDEHSEEQTSDG